MSQSSERFLPQLIHLEPIIHKFSNPFLRKIEEQFHQAQAYEHQDTIENAKRKIPGAILRDRVTQKYKILQEDTRKGFIFQGDIQDLMLVELLHWFKEEFFEWVDTPDCENCGNKTVYSNVIHDSYNKFAKRIEVFKCDVCRKDTLFPRFTDLNILLETRRGRCGEWANVFTLMCWSLNFEARLVVDETDHVWTEVYSRYQKRWLHCDPCEDLCDSPLMYEIGWKKKLSYIIAYSPVEVQDVTWRYTSNFKEVLKRRKQCTERDLVEAILQLRNERLAKFSKLKQEMIKKRTIIELADFLTERQTGEEIYDGRKSGSLDWRKARGDILEVPKATFAFALSPQISKMEFLMRYSCSTDKYECETELGIDKWDQGTYSQVDMMRKVEKDWNKVYLCRKEGTETGTIVWMFRLSDSSISISSVYIKLKSETFEDGKVEVTAVGSTSAEKEITLHIAGEETRSMDFQGCRFLQITATLSGGRGPTAWQHAQLFRQPWKCDSAYYPFEVFLTFEKII